VTRRLRRQLMVGAVACYFAPILLAPWMGSSITGSFPSPPIADWRYEFGWVRWLTLQHDPAKPASGLQVEWTLDAAGLCANLAATLALCFGVWAIVGWLVRHTAPRGRCDRCGYAVSATRDAVVCSECGELSTEATRARAISPGSRWLLILALALLGVAGNLEVLRRLFEGTLPTVARVIDPNSPAWTGFEFDRWLGGHYLALWAGSLLIGACLFMVWLYREPSKHPPDRIAMLLKRLVR